MGLTKLSTGMISLQFLETLKGLVDIFVSLEINTKWILIIIKNIREL